MPNYKRVREGRTFFFTVVTYRRRPILTTPLGRRCLRRAIEIVRRRLPFDMIAIVLLPDHLHTVWELPVADTDYSTRWRLIKFHFTKHWLAANSQTGPLTESRKKRREQTIWQRRFFEHTCCDEIDLKRCVDYIHVNPLKHQLVEGVKDWPWSSFHRFAKEGEYPVEWGNANVWYGDEFRHFE